MFAGGIRRRFGWAWSSVITRWGWSADAEVVVAVPVTAVEPPVDVSAPVAAAGAGASAVMPPPPGVAVPTAVVPAITMPVVIGGSVSVAWRGRSRGELIASQVGVLKLALATFGVAARAGRRRALRRLGRVVRLR